MPYTADGACRLAGALHDVDEHVEHPLTVWWWDVSSGQERRGTLYGWRAGDGERFALIVTRGAWDACRPGGDCVRWVPEHFTRVRNE